ncbi:magnesium transporter CorA family protein [Halovulum dunhuangense]|uniref:Magnesium transport protein CorA n=1 Tax=Halovulum dunhuangense TaxID=1505036 RepID=A0A849L1Z1_9RHOB|nr:magnesium transporter CorA family protein [Halovulum dunhuangense]NNU80285.1 magnesium transporter CorA family protein [Halovulum dunhuangense]
MIRGFTCEGGRLRPVEDAMARLDALVWIDMIAPDAEEERRVEAALGLNVPTRAEMEEIELSSRLYTEDGVSYMTAILPARAEGQDPYMGPVTFVLAGHCLITVRYHEPRAFATFPAMAEKGDMGCTGAETVLIGLLDTIVDRLADILEHVGREIDAMSGKVFKPAEGKRPRGSDYQAVLEHLGRTGDLTSNIRDSLVTMERLVGFLGQALTAQRMEKVMRERVRGLATDLRALADHANFLSQKTTFLLEAVLGLIQIEQNAIIKIFSVAAVVFLPPTLIASIYGMNFEHMPELGWRLGYPAAILGMIASAILPFVYFKRRGWL